MLSHDIYLAAMHLWVKTRQMQNKVGAKADVLWKLGLRKASNKEASTWSACSSLHRRNRKFTKLREAKFNPLIRCSGSTQVRRFGTPDSELSPRCLGLTRARLTDSERRIVEVFVDRILTCLFAGG